MDDKKFITRASFNEIIDVLTDLNKSIRMHVDNHDSPDIDEAIMRVAGRISIRLRELRDKE